MVQIVNDFKDPEDGFWDKNNSEGIVSSSEAPLILDIRGEWSISVFDSNMSLRSCSM